MAVAFLEGVERLKSAPSRPRVAAFRKKLRASLPEGWWVDFTRDSLDYDNWGVVAGESARGFVPGRPALYYHRQFGFVVSARLLFGHETEFQHMQCYQQPQEALAAYALKYGL